MIYDEQWNGSNVRHRYSRPGLDQSDTRNVINNHSLQSIILNILVLYTQYRVLIKYVECTQISILWELRVVGNADVVGGEGLRGEFAGERRGHLRNAVRGRRRRNVGRRRKDCDAGCGRRAVRRRALPPEVLVLGAGRRVVRTQRAVRHLP